MDENLKKELRKILMERYGVDINDAKLEYSTRHYAFIFPDRPYMIRVSMTPRRTRQEILSELLWVDDLKLFKQTVCEPELSLNKNIMEEFDINGTLYRASMFRTARGSIQSTIEITPMFFICVGELLGAIHMASTDERRLGMSYKRKSMKELHAERKEKVYGSLSPKLRKRIDEITEKAFSLPEDEGLYGICHGDFHMNNFFVEANNIWLFDFDSCLYTHYLYDVAAFVVDCLQKGYMKGMNCRSILYEHIMPYLKIGYALNKPCGKGYWDALELFIDLRIAVTVMELQDIDDCGALEDLNKIKDFYKYILKSGDSLAAMTELLRKEVGGKETRAEEKIEKIYLQDKSLGLESVPNARQLGGYVCLENRRVKQDTLLRTGSMENLSDCDAQKLCEKYNVAEVIDLRTRLERNACPDREIAGARNTHISVLEDEDSESVLGKVLENMSAMDNDKIGRLIEYSKIKGFDDIYKELLLSKKAMDGYSLFFRILLMAEGSVLWHCSQGKDRTGIGAALILTALGADEKTVIEDYELTNEAYTEEREYIRNEALKRGCSEEEARRVSIIGAGVDKNDLIAAFKSVKEKYGSVMNYIIMGLGLSQVDIDTLRKKYLE